MAGWGDGGDALVGELESVLVGVGLLELLHIVGQLEHQLLVTLSLLALCFILFVMRTKVRKSKVKMLKN